MKYVLHLLAAMLVLVAVLGVCYTLYFARPILMPITLAVVLTFLFSPLVRRLEEWNLHRGVSSGFVVGGLALIFGLVAYQLSAPAARWIQQAPTTLRHAEYKLRTLRQPIEELSEASQQVQNLAAVESDAEPVLKVQVEQPSLTDALFNTTWSFVAGAIITVVLMFFLLAQGDHFLAKLISLFSLEESSERRTLSLIRDIEHGVSDFLRVYAIINIGLGIAIGTALWLLGLPNPFLWGVMAGFLNFIPYLGAMAGASIVFLVALLQFDTVGQAALAPLIYITINSLEGYLITPVILGRSMHLNPVMVFVALIFWGWLWGIGGALLAVPLLAVFKIVCERSKRLGRLGELLG